MTFQIFVLFVMYSNVVVESALGFIFKNTGQQYVTTD